MASILLSLNKNEDTCKLGESDIIIALKKDLKKEKEKHQRTRDQKLEIEEREKEMAAKIKELEEGNNEEDSQVQVLDSGMLAILEADLKKEKEKYQRTRDR
mmetsp:Transcript_2538/g.3758  ORF Transcript_2538/g.3758 Transcript_2538/m.3758 type:complete len:101 (-) Transcript_2538:211-513(-)